MTKKRGHRKMRYSRRSRKVSKRPVGFIKSKGKFRLAFRASKNAKGKNIIKTKSGKKFRLGKGFETQKALAKHFVSKYRRR